MFEFDFYQDWLTLLGWEQIELFYHLPCQVFHQFQIIWICFLFGIIRIARPGFGWFGMVIKFLFSTIWIARPHFGSYRMVIHFFFSSMFKPRSSWGISVALTSIGRNITGEPYFEKLRFSPDIVFLAALAALYLTLVSDSLTLSLTGCHFRILAQIVTFETCDPSDIWSARCLDKKTKKTKKKAKRQKDKKTKR